MRFIVASCALLSCCSAAQAERIKILSVAVTHFTQRDTVDIELLLNHSFTPGVDHFMFTGGDGWWSYGLPGGHSFRIQNGGIAAPTEDFTVALRRHPAQGVDELVSREPTPPVTIRDVMEDGVMRHSIAMSFPTESLAFDQMDMRRGYFNYIVTVLIDGASDGVSGISETNTVHHTPEPSSVALLGVGGVLLLVHLVHRPCFRVGRTKRHVGREPTGVGIG